MSGWAIFALLIATILCSICPAQDAGNDAATVSGPPGILRLPPVEEQAPRLEKQTLPADKVVSTQYLVTDPSSERAPSAEITPEMISPAATPQPPPKPWEGSFELGLDGTEGNSNTLNFRFGFDVERKTDDHVFSLDLDYNKKTTEGEEATNRAFLDWRLERLLAPSPWTMFVHETVEYDEFQAFDARVAVDAGFGYRIVESKRGKLAARLGAGFSREIGGPDDTYIPEAVFGLDFEHRLSKRQKFTLSNEFAPDVTAWNDFRLNTQAGWKVLIDEEMNLSLKLSVLNRYDSTPHGAEANDVDYSAVLLWSF